MSLLPPVFMFRPVHAALCLGFLALPWRISAGENISRPGVLHLTLEDAIRMALAKSFRIEVSRFEPKAAEQRVTASLGRFDPTFDVSFDRGRDARRGLFLGTTNERRDRIIETENLSAGIGGLTPLGTQYDFRLGTAFGSNNATGSNDQATGAAGFELTQPLLRGGGFAANLSEVRIARTNLLESEWQLRQNAIDVITEAVFVYQELHHAHENLAVARRSRGLAQQTLRDNSQRVDIGVMSPLDVTTARAEAASREESVILAQRDIKDNENLLKQLVTRDLTPMLDVQVEIEPPISPSFQADVRAGIRRALEIRPDYRRAILELERRNITLAFQKNQALPQLDLTGSLRLLGFDDDRGGSLLRTARRDGTAWTAGAIFSLPIPNREGRGAENAARILAAQQLVQLQQLEQQIVVDVDNASGQVVTGRERIASTIEASALARESVEAGEQRLRAGTGTTFEVLELQDRLALAELAEVRARADYNKAVNEYYRKTGTTLQIYHVEIGALPSSSNKTKHPSP